MRKTRTNLSIDPVSSRDPEEFVANEVTDLMWIPMSKSGAFGFRRDHTVTEGPPATAKRSEFGMDSTASTGNLWSNVLVLGAKSISDFAVRLDSAGSLVSHSLTVWS